LLYCYIACSFGSNKNNVLNIAFYIAKHIAFNRQKSFSRFIIRLSAAATAISVMAMIVTIAFVNGFQKTVSEKVFSFWGHIHVQHYEQTKVLMAQESAIEKNDTVEQIIKHQPGVNNIQAFATRSAVLQYKKEIDGILLKGIESSYNSTKLKPFIKKGRWLQFNNSTYSKEIIISEPIAKELQLDVDDTLSIYFVTNGGASAARHLKIAGIYKTGIDEYDKLYAISDIRLIQRINGWNNNQIGGYEVFLNDYHKMDTINEQILNKIPAVWQSQTIKDVNSTIFDWLNTQDVNRNLIIVIMAIVAVINLITCLLILVLERTRMVGILKALGARNNIIQLVFLYQATFITLTGIGIGLIAGVGLCLLQQYTGIITLNEELYAIATAQVDLVWWQVALICIATAVVCFASLIIPTLLVKNIKPIKAIQFR
jgi:lipoprotein-releasing system permease protein